MRVIDEGVGGMEMTSGAVTPDGRWVAARDYSTAESALYPLAGGSRRKILGLQPHELAVQWSPDGRHLFVQEARDNRAGRSISVARLDS
jgi:Tol biopolymer transport system component